MGILDALRANSPLLMAMGGDFMSGDYGRSTMPALALQDRRQMDADAMARMEQDQAAYKQTLGGMQLPGGLAAVLGGMEPQKGLGVLAQMMTGGGPQADMPALVQEYEYARQNGFSGSFMDYQQARGNRQQTGLTPIPVVNDDGAVEYFLPTTTGDATPLRFPEGAQPTRPGRTVDTGASFELIDDITGDRRASIPKDERTPAEQRAAGTAVGQAEGQAAANAPGALRQAEEMLSIIDGVATDPQLGNALGWGGYSVIPDVPGVNTGPRAKVAQLQGRAFLQAFETLKGSGQITEIEGEKATEAIARLRTTQTEAEFRAALDDLRGIVVTARERALRLGSGQQPFSAERDLQGISDDDLKKALGL